ncbi:Uncharacterised protein [Klebsiella pneumoniae]|uniref:Uncharacterized protein n=1 Tax=Klebsiella pneumoniae TaxID=573 RepID=A0A2X3F400_KLEPN|nr:Uncharacterised protein [Klebsiella pneumoniae]
MSAAASDSGIKQVFLPSLMLLLSGLLRRDNQHLTRIDFVGMGQHRFIGFKKCVDTHWPSHTSLLRLRSECHRI